MKEWKRKSKLLQGLYRDYYRNPLLHSRLTKGTRIQGSSFGCKRPSPCPLKLINWECIDGSGSSDLLESKGPSTQQEGNLGYKAQGLGFKGIGGRNYSICLEELSLLSLRAI